MLQQNTGYKQKVRHSCFTFSIRYDLRTICTIYEEDLLTASNKYRSRSVFSTLT